MREYLVRVAEWAGLEGVSIVVLVALVSIIAWSSRAKHAGSLAGSAVSTTRWLALSLVLLGLAGVVSFHPARAAYLWGWFAEKAPIVARWLSEL